MKQFFLIIFIIFFSWKSVASLQDFQSIFEAYNEGRYRDVITELDQLENKYTQDKEKLGIIAYWKALSLGKINESETAVQHFQKSIKLGYIPEDLYYELGQMFYASRRLNEARNAFRTSVSKDFKVAVSLYYMGVISLEQGDDKRAVAFFQMVEDLKDEEKSAVIQAARAQIGDIFLRQVEGKHDYFASIENSVIPQYYKAYTWDPDSKLGQDLKARIEKLQKRYDLVLFKMRNGRETQNPPHFMRLNVGVAHDSNVNRVSDTSSRSVTHESSLVSNYGFFGRYSFYPSDAYSVATELQTNFYKFHSDDPAVKMNDQFDLRGGIKLNFEHSYRDRPATTYLEYDYSYGANAMNPDEKLKKFDGTHMFGISEEIPFFKENPSIFRFRYYAVKGVDELNSFQSQSYIWEQLYTLGTINLYSYLSQDINRYSVDKNMDNNTLSGRLDFIFPTIANLFNSNVYISYSQTSFELDQQRDKTSAYTLGLSLNRPFSKRLFGTLTLEQTEQTGELDIDTFKKRVIGMNLEYFF